MLHDVYNNNDNTNNSNNNNTYNNTPHMLINYIQ